MYDNIHRVFSIFQEYIDSCQKTSGILAVLRQAHLMALVVAADWIQLEISWILEPRYDAQTYALMNFDENSSSLAHWLPSIQHQTPCMMPAMAFSSLRNPSAASSVVLQWACADWDCANKIK